MPGRRAGSGCGKNNAARALKRTAKVSTISNLWVSHAASCSAYSTYRLPHDSAICIADFCLFLLQSWRGYSIQGVIGAAYSSGYLFKLANIILKSTFITNMYVLFTVYRKFVLVSIWYACIYLLTIVAIQHVDDSLGHCEILYSVQS